MGAIEHPPILSLAPLGIPDYVFYTWVVMAILLAVSVAATRNCPRGPPIRARKQALDPRFGE